MTELPSSTPPSKKPPYLLYATCACVVALSGFGGFYIYDTQQKAHQAQQEAIRLAEEEKAKQKADMDALSEEYLQKFVTELREKATHYKKQKRVLKQLISPYNFETPDYSKDNYHIFMKEIAPSLRVQADTIIQTFEVYTEKLKSEIKDNDDALQQEFMREWNVMSADQLSHYIDFFSREEKLLQAYEELIRFYYIHSNLFTIDIEENKFEFKRSKDRIKQAELLKAIEELKSLPQAK